jgi:hypothetical protein
MNDTRTEQITEALIQLIDIAQMQIQFVDYSENQWTVPVKIRMSDIQSAMKDNSVKEIRIIIKP